MVKLKEVIRENDELFFVFEYLVSGAQAFLVFIVLKWCAAGSPYVDCVFLSTL